LSIQSKDNGDDKTPEVSQKVANQSTDPESTDSTVKNGASVQRDDAEATPKYRERSPSQSVVESRRRLQKFVTSLKQQICVTSQ